MRRTWPALAIVLFVFAPVRGQEALSMLGQRVVIRYRRPLTIGAVNVEPEDYRAYTVDRVEGDMVWLVSGSVSGWIPKDQVMTLDEAIAYYTEDVRHNPNAWNSYLYRGFVWDVKHQYERAIADYTEAIRIYPLWANTFNNRGWTYHRLKRYERAIADYNAAIRLDPHCVLAIVNRGFAREDTDDYYKAIDDFKRAIHEDPKYGRAHGALAWLYATCPDRRFRDGNLAVRSATTACELTRWKDPGKVAILAAAYAEAGDFKKAVQWQRQANDRYLDPEDRRTGRERLALFEAKKPFRVTAEAIHRSEGAPEAGHPFAQFRDPEQAARIFDELRARAGHPPEAISGHEREVFERKLTAAVEHVARKYHLRRRDVRAIWHAGLGDSAAANASGKAPDA